MRRSGGGVTFLSANKKVTKEVAYEGAELIAPAIKAAPSNSPPAFMFVQHRFSAAVRLVAAGKCGYPKDMETGVRCVIRRSVAVLWGNWFVHCNCLRSSVVLSEGEAEVEESVPVW